MNQTKTYLTDNRFDSIQEINKWIQSYQMELDRSYVRYGQVGMLRLHGPRVVWLENQIKKMRFELTLLGNSDG